MDPKTQALVQQIMARYPGMAPQQALQMAQNITGQSGPQGAQSVGSMLGNALSFGPGGIGTAAPQSAQPRLPFQSAVLGGPDMVASQISSAANPSAPLSAPLQAPPRDPVIPPSAPSAPQAASNDSDSSAPKSVTSSSDSTTNSPNQPATPPPSGGAASPAPQTGAQDGSPFQGNNGDARTQQIYGIGANEQPRDWANRVFMQGMADNGQNLYADTNPNANGPWANFVKARYGTDLPMQALMGTLENPVGAYDSSSGSGGVPNAIRDTMKTLATGGGSPAGGIGGLQKVGSLMQAALGGDPSMDPLQAARLKDIANDPTTSASMIASQLTGATGGWGMNNVRDRLSGLQQHYYDDPFNMDPAAGGQKVPFYNQALKMFGLGG